MQVLQAVITGAIQGLSEFLPISSSAHIVFSNALYSLITGHQLPSVAGSEEIFFDIIVHFATLIAVVIYFFNDLKIMVKDSYIALKQKQQNENSKIMCYIALTTIITGIMGFILQDTAKMLIARPKIICALLVVTGLILLTCEKLYKGNKKINLKKSILIGIAQGFAIFPGFSRSGLTIAAALFQGVERIESARFSFLMSIPIIALASMVYPIIELDISDFAAFNHKAIIIGFLTSFVVGYLCVKYFMQLLKKFTLKFFGYYCLLAAVVMFLIFQFCYHV